MNFPLDTDNVSHHLRRLSGLQHRSVQHSGRLDLSVVGLAELQAWAYIRPNPEPVLDSIRTLLRDELVVLSFDEACAETFGKLRGLLKRAGTSVAPLDLMIAATALTHEMTLVTRNTAHFREIPDLELDDWVPG